MANVENEKGTIGLGEAIERILIESGLSISAFSRKVGYSRQYIYELLKSKDSGFARKIQLDTLKKICDASDYSLERLLSEIGYLPKAVHDTPANTVVVVRKNGEKAAYSLSEGNVALVAELVKSLEKSRSER